MHEGAVIVDMAAANGGNCQLTEPDKVVVKHGVILCGYTNFPALMPTDASQFFARNLYNFLIHLLDLDNGEARFKDPLADELSSMTLITHMGKVRFETTKNAKKTKAG